ncbi:hypothetical protein MAJHIDBO_01343 [Propionibacterium freudenreichii subsp. shermanii]|nr:hypothetical protein MAJHIDBO_01343 [Propionibacterium freudenreichii subsp. shermanii]SPS09138.1 hypothetical protein MAJHIDBO_01343 [Propionibacterium freudenreichii subsp. shermanii]
MTWASPWVVRARTVRSRVRCRVADLDVLQRCWPALHRLVPGNLLVRENLLVGGGLLVGGLVAAAGFDGDVRHAHCQELCRQSDAGRGHTVGDLHRQGVRGDGWNRRVGAGEHHLVGQVVGRQPPQQGPRGVSRGDVGVRAVGWHGPMMPDARSGPRCAPWQPPGPDGIVRGGASPGTIRRAGCPTGGAIPRARPSTWQGHPPGGHSSRRLRTLPGRYGRSNGRSSSSA